MLCKNCKKSFRFRKKHKEKFCSRKCFDAFPKDYLLGNKHNKSAGWNKGMKRWWHSPTQWEKGHHLKEEHWNWKGGISRTYKIGYYSTEYKEWRKKVFERDDYTCQDCGIKNTYLTAHHIKSFTYYPELRFDLDNGKALCEDCHKRTDNYKGKARSAYRLNGVNSGKVQNG
jgi:5-methylcytosine-specific restriction endonuclease McrA